jgi:hypothetical protein
MECLAGLGQPCDKGSSPYENLGSSFTTIWQHLVIVGGIGVVIKVICCSVPYSFFPFFSSE